MGQELGGASGHITPVISDLIPQGVSHLQYAGDTIILLEYSELCLANLKFILLCFEAMSGLKINFLKSEVILLNGLLEICPRDRSEERRVGKECQP